MKDPEQFQVPVEIAPAQIHMTKSSMTIIDATLDPKARAPKTTIVSFE